MSYYLDENGKPILKTSYCAVLDVLGFSKKVQEEDDVVFFQNYLDVFQKNKEKLTKFYDEEEDKKLIEIASFSDNIAIGAPIWSHDGEPEFGRIVSDISYFQLFMALDGMFVRGGLSVGQLHMGSGFVYGAALIDAHELESKQAMFPRVVLSKDVLKLMDRHLTYYHPPAHSPQNRDIWKDADGHCYINYLDWLILDDDADSPSIGWEELDLHKDNILRNMQENSGNYHIWLKYKWLSDYHNAFTMQLSHLPTYSKSLLIPDELTRVYPVRYVED